MWFFMDETWAPEDAEQQFGILLGVLCEEDGIAPLDEFLYSVRKKYFGKEHAKDLHREFKGKRLLSNAILKKQFDDPKQDIWLNNVAIVKELLAYPVKEDAYIKVVASIVYSTHDKKPSLLSPDPKRLTEPFRLLVSNVSQAARECAPKKKVTLVFDQRFGAQEDYSIAVRNFIGGMGLKNIRPYPLIGVSNAIPPIQVADIFATLLSKRAQGDRRVMQMYKELAKLEWKADAPSSYRGFNRLEEIVNPDGGMRYRRRNKW